MDILSPEQIPYVRGVSDNYPPKSERLGMGHPK